MLHHDRNVEQGEIYYIIGFPWELFGYKRGGKLLIAIFQGGTIASGKKELYNTGIMLFTVTKMTGKYRSCDLHCICLLKESTQLLN